MQIDMCIDMHTDMHTDMHFAMDYGTVGNLSAEAIILSIVMSIPVQ